LRNHRFHDGRSRWAIPEETHNFAADNCDCIHVILRAGLRVLSGQRAEFAERLLFPIGPFFG
jgi:hypothetical protein